MIKCPACGTDNSTSANFCISCGFDLNATATDQRVRTDSVSAPSASTPPYTSPSVEMPREYLDSAPPPVQPPPMPPPPAQPWSNGLPNYTPPPLAAQVEPPKQRVLAIGLEALGGLFSLPGIGWMYSGNVGLGIAILVGFIFAQMVMFTIDIFTLALFTCIHVPVWIGTVVVSSILLYNHTKQHPEQFGP